MLAGRSFRPAARLLPPAAGLSKAKQQLERLAGVLTVVYDQLLGSCEQLRLPPELELRGGVVLLSDGEPFSEQQLPDVIPLPHCNGRRRELALQYLLVQPPRGLRQLRPVDKKALSGHDASQRVQSLVQDGLQGEATCLGEGSSVE